MCLGSKQNKKHVRFTDMGRPRPILAMQATRARNHARHTSSGAVHFCTARVMIGCVSTEVRADLKGASEDDMYTQNFLQGKNFAVPVTSSRSIDSTFILTDLRG